MNPAQFTFDYRFQILLVVFEQSCAFFMRVTSNFNIIELYIPFGLEYNYISNKNILFACLKVADISGVRIVADISIPNIYIYYWIWGLYYEKDGFALRAGFACSWGKKIRTIWDWFYWLHPKCHIKAWDKWRVCSRVQWSCLQLQCQA